MLPYALWAAALATQVPIPRAELCARSPLVVLAEVTGVEGRFTQDGAIETLVDLAVLRTLRGAAPAGLVVVVPGGRAGGLSLSVSEAPRLSPDARYLLLLAPRADGHWAPVGGAQGVSPVPWGVDLASVGGCDGA